MITPSTVTPVSRTAITIITPSTITPVTPTPGPRAIITIGVGVIAIRIRVGVVAITIGVISWGRRFNSRRRDDWRE
jgi:hypothetical protein